MAPMPLMPPRGSLVLLLMVLSCSVFAGQITPIAPFTGIYQETWETFPRSDPAIPSDPIKLLSDGTPILSGEAAIFGSDGYIYRLWTDCVGLGRGFALVSDGSQGMYSWAGPVTITFSTPVTEFGAYWGLAFGGDLPDPNTLQLSFFDVSDDLVGTTSFTYSKTDYLNTYPWIQYDPLDWHGYSFDVPVKTVQYYAPSTGIAIDGLQADPAPVPEPSSVFGTLVGLVAASTTLKRARPRPS